MDLRRATILASLLISSVCYAQFSDDRCVAGPVSVISHHDGVTTKAVTFSGKFGEVSAQVFLPDTDSTVPGVAFSQSAIHYSDSTVDLFPFAHALARAGAASIMLKGTIDWQTPNDDFKRHWGEFDCAGRWFMANANLDPKRLAIGGPIEVKGVPLCENLGKEPCQPWIWVNYGWNDSPAVRVTEQMKTPQGQLEMSSLVTVNFHLKKVRLEWLVENSVNSSLAKR